MKHYIVICEWQLVDESGYTIHAVTDTKDVAQRYLDKLIDDANDYVAEHNWTVYTAAEDRFYAGQFDSYMDIFIQEDETPEI